MGSGFDPVRDVGAAVGGLAAAVGSAAQAVAESASKAVADIGEGLFGEHGAGAAASTRSRVPEFLYSGEVSASSPIVPRSIYVREVVLDARGKPMRGRRRLLRMSKKGVQLLASDSPFSPPAETVAVGNCALFQDGRTPMGNPLLGSLGGGFGGGIAFGPIGAIAGAIMGGAAAFATDEVWFAEIGTVDGDERVFELGSRSDGDKILEFLDAYMRA